MMKCTVNLGSRYNFSEESENGKSANRVELDRGKGKETEG